METHLWIAEEHLTFMDISPIEDYKDHFLGDECWCNPRFELVPGGIPDLMIVHSLYDDVQ